MNKMRKVWIVWGFLSFFLIGSLCAIAILYKQKSQKYKKLENRLVGITKKYTSTDFNYPEVDKSIIITYNKLKDEGLINKLEIEDKKCDGYVVISNNGVIEYKAYIDCNVYKTHGFNKKNLKS